MPQMMRRRMRRGASLIDVVVGAMVMAGGVLSFAALYPTAAQSSRLASDYSQAIAAAQHKVDQLRAIGYGRLTYAEMKNAGLIDASPTASPFRFDGVDGLNSYLTLPTGTITLTSHSTGVTRAKISIRWRSAIGRYSTHEVTVLVAQE